MTEDDALVAALAAQTGLTVHAPGLGLGDGRLPVVFFALADLDDAARARLAADHLDDDGAIVRPGVEPIAIVGGPGTFELGDTLDDALPAAAVLLLDREAGTVLGWDRVPVNPPIPISSTLAALDVS